MPGTGRPIPVLHVHPTRYCYRGDADPSRPGGITEIYRDLARDDDRTRQVTADVIAALSGGRNCLILTNWTSHLERIAALLRDAGHDPVVLRGGRGVKSRAAAQARLDRDPDGTPLLVAGTGPYVGEGFDCPSLDTLFLDAPRSHPRASSSSMSAVSCARIRARPPPKYTTITTSTPVSSPPLSPDAHPATSASGSPTRAASP